MEAVHLPTNGSPYTFALCISSIWLSLNCILYNKLVNVSKASEVVVVGNSEFVVGQAEVWFSWGLHLRLASEVMWNGDLNLGGFG